MGYKAIQTQKLVTRHPIRHQNDSEIIDDKWEYFDVGRNVPVIDKPVVDRHKRSQKAKEKLKEFESIQKIDLATAKLVIGKEFFKIVIELKLGQGTFSLISI